MSAYETVIANLLRTRISQGITETSFGMIFDARAAEAIWPGTLEVVGTAVVVRGKDVGVAVREFLKANGFGIVGYPVVQEGINGTGTFPANNAPSWVRTKFVFGQWPAAPLYGDAMNGMRNLVLSKVFPAIASIPLDLRQTISQLFSIGIMVYPANADAPWLSAEDKEAFGEIVSATKPVIKQYSSARLADLALQGNILQGNADLWNTVTRITAAVASFGFSEVSLKIEEMRAKLKEFAATKKKALAIADTMFGTERVNALNGIAAEEAKVKASLGALYVFVPGLDKELQGQGLGAWQLAGGVAAAVIIAKIAMVITACGAAIYLMFKLTGAVGGGFSAVGGIAGVALVGMGLFFLWSFGKKKLASA